MINSDAIARQGMDKKIKLVAGEGAGECFGPVRLLGGDGTETMKMAMLARGGRGERLE